MSTSLAWDERYAGGDFQFGEAPNLFLLSQAYRLRRGMRALAAGDGEGRNGVWLAEQGLDATSVDWSDVGLAKARALAERRGVPITTVTADLSRWDWPEACAGALRALAPGGVLVLECFTPAQEGRRSGGPKDPALLWSRALVERHFAGLEVLELMEGAVRLDEGPRHQGLAEVVRAVLRRAA